jgi:hypothetical protein
LKRKRGKKGRKKKEKRRERREKRGGRISLALALSEVLRPAAPHPAELA